MSTILLTGGRGVFSLALARAMHAAGHRVLVADSWPRIMCRYSSAVNAFFHVPAPAQATSAWMDHLLRIVDQNEVDLIVPLYEEVFYLARAIADLPDPPKVFASDFRTLITVHNKWSFNQKAREVGLPVPQTDLMTDRSDVLSLYSSGNGGNLVFKPAYSRFATHTIVRPGSVEALDAVAPTAQRPWVAQDFLPGRPVSTFSIAHRGRISAHAAYAVDFSFGVGPALAYRPLDQPPAFDWVRRFVESTAYTGQIGIDFIEDASGEVAAIECNPCITGGMFLLKDDPDFTAAYLDRDAGPILAAPSRSYSFRAAMFFALFFHNEHFPGAEEWARVLLRSRSTSEFLWSDPLPRFAEPLLNLAFLCGSIRKRKAPRASATADFEWSEDPPDATPRPDAETQLVSDPSSPARAPTPTRAL